MCSVWGALPRRLLTNTPHDFSVSSAPQLRAEYVSVVSRVLAAHFRTYLSAMEKMVAPVAGQGDVLGVPPELAGAAGAMGQFGGSVMSAMSGAMGLFGKAQGRATSVSKGGWGAGQQP